LLFTYPKVSIKDPQGEAFSPQKRTFSTSKDENSVLFSIFLGHFALLDPDPDPNPTAQINADLCGSGSETLFLSLLDPDPDPLVRGTNPAPDPSIIKQK
jgi:hypothetical protein